MSFQLTPKFKRNLSRIFPFGIIWLANGLLFLFVESAATENQNMSPSTAITLSIPILIFSSIAVTIVGWLVGTIEMVILEKRFSNYKLVSKIFYKGLIYLSFILLIIITTYPIAAMIESGSGLSNPEIWNKMGRFLFSMTFLSTMIQIGFSLFFSLLYAAISENLGHQVLLNFFTGKYHKPINENRIFMFLDMKSSTTIAEKLGHIRYFDLLKEYYETMSDPIINHLGEVYQYIGDEVVVTWKSEKGLDRANCVRCFYAIKENMKKQCKAFEKKYGLCPDFKAGIHLGEVSTGEVGALKKEIVYTGDVLNTTARIQGMCKEYKTDLVISEDLKNGLPDNQGLMYRKLGSAILRGKTRELDLYAAELKS